MACSSRVIAATLSGGMTAGKFEGLWGIGPPEHGAALAALFQNAPVDTLVDVLFSRIGGGENRPVFNRIGR